MTGKFVVVEGPDGAGKSLMVELLTDMLNAAGVSCVSLREPGTTECGEKIRSMLKNKDLKMSDKTQWLLFEAARAELVPAVVNMMTKGNVVITDRFTLSTEVYQGIAADRPVSRDLLKTINDYVVDGLTIDMLIYVTASLKTCMDRIHDRLKDDDKDRFDCRSRAYARKVHQGYESLDLNEYCKNNIVVENDSDLDQLKNRASTIVEDILQMVTTPSVVEEAPVTVKKTAVSSPMKAPAIMGTSLGDLLDKVVPTVAASVPPHKEISTVASSTKNTANTAAPTEIVPPRDHFCRGVGYRAPLEQSEVWYEQAITPDVLICEDHENVAGAFRLSNYRDIFYAFVSQQKEKDILIPMLENDDDLKKLVQQIRENPTRVPSGFAVAKLVGCTMDTTNVVHLIKSLRGDLAEKYSLCSIHKATTDALGVGVLQTIYTPFLIRK